MLSDNNDIDIKQEIDGKRNLRTYCIGCGFKNFEASNKEELSDLARRLNYKTLLYYCSKCRKNEESKNPKVSKTNNGKTELLSKCVVYDSKKKGLGCWAN